MKADDDNKQDRLIRSAIGRDCPPFDFERWQQTHRRQIEEYRAQPPSSSRRRTFVMGGWRGRSRGLKIALAAAILFTAALLASRFTVSLDGATAAYARVQEAVWKVPWMRVRYTGMDLDPNGKQISPEGALDTEIWYSFNAQTVIRKYHGGHIVYNDYARQQVYTYNPTSHRIILTAFSRYHGSSTADTPSNWLERNIRVFTSSGGTTTRRTGQYQGRTVDVFEVASDPKPGVTTIHDRVYVDRSTFLPIAEERTFINPDIGKLQRVETGVFDYPEQGPADIYDLGLDRDIPIINSLPLPEWQEIQMAYQHHSYWAPVPRYTALVVERMMIGDHPVSTVEVCYADGSHFRREHHSPYGPGASIGEQWAEQAAEFGDTFESILRWLQARKARGRISIELYETNRYHYCQRDEDGLWNRSERVVPRECGDCWGICPVSRLGWPDIRGEVDLIQDNYAKKENLIRAEAGGQIFWLNPARDYICQCWFDTNGEHRVTEFGRTDDGHWYPAQIEGNGVHTTVYLKTNPEFPEGIFDPKPLPGERTQ